MRKLTKNISDYSISVCCLTAMIFTLVLLSSADLSAQESRERERLYSNTRPDRDENVKQDPVQLIDNIWWVGHSEVGSFLITTPDGLILLDPTSSETVAWVVENIVKAGFHLEDIKYIINTHPHEHHIGGLAALQRLLPHAKIITTREAADIIATGGKNDFRQMFREMEGEEGEYFEPVRVDGFIDHLETLTLGGITLTAHHTPGHNTGTTTWSLKVSDNGQEYDAVIMGGMSAYGVDRVPLVNNELYPDIVTDFIRSFAHLKTLQCDIYLDSRASSVRLHEKLALLENSDNKVNPFVDPEGCQHYINFYEARFQKQLESENSGTEN